MVVAASPATGLRLIRQPGSGTNICEDVIEHRERINSVEHRIEVPVDTKPARTKRALRVLDSFVDGARRVVVSAQHEVRARCRTGDNPRGTVSEQQVIAAVAVRRTRDPLLDDQGSFDRRECRGRARRIVQFLHPLR